MSTLYTCCHSIHESNLLSQGSEGFHDISCYTAKSFHHQISQDSVSNWSCFDCGHYFSYFIRPAGHLFSSTIFPCWNCIQLWWTMEIWNAIVFLILHQKYEQNLLYWLNKGWYINIDSWKKIQRNLQSFSIYNVYQKINVVFKYSASHQCLRVFFNIDNLARRCIYFAFKFHSYYI